MLIPKFLNWEECSLNEYSDICFKYGFNCESSPQFLSFMLKNNAPLKFFAFRKKGEPLGGACVENGWLANDYKNKSRTIKSLLIPKQSIFLPLREDSKYILPFKSKCLHPLQKKLFINSSYELFSKRKVAIAKNPVSDFSKKTISTREREIRKFVASGGSFKPIGEIEPDNLFDIYNDLYRARRNKSVSDPELNKVFFKEFHHSFKGEIMMMDDEPIAIQLLLSVENVSNIFVDYINIGYKTSSKTNSLGTIMMWRNLSRLNYEAVESGKNLYFSFGHMSGDYKERWCIPASVGRSLI
ncbi:transcriptional regulator [Enterobacter cloacae subsp. cloacae]|uniref:transcriptional regulator n=1 Tax=Enterobacter cloacae TaxID=550 RepID=UPI0006D9AD4C|nr:transcriptional regulator [Enterobacter cloacae]KPU05794.1 transcriptional regulator [Enterobacter cloacae subsp. cloacae]